jgi:hypothetical protein
MIKPLTLLIIAGAFALGVESAAAQGGRQPAKPPGQGERQAAAGRGAGGDVVEERPITPAEIQAMFDSYALMQAQQQLKINDEHFPQFLTRFKTLQEVRRKALLERARVIQDLRRMLNNGNAKPDDAQIKERVKAITDLESKAQDDVRKAYESIDQVLDVQQQGKFRVFEENMERRKLDLVTRARAANRPKNRQQKNPQ